MYWEIHGWASHSGNKLWEYLCNMRMFPPHCIWISWQDDLSLSPDSLVFAQWAHEHVDMVPEILVLDLLNNIDFPDSSSRSCCHHWKPVNQHQRSMSGYQCGKIPVVYQRVTYSELMTMDFQIIKKIAMHQIITPSADYSMLQSSALYPT